MPLDEGYSRSSVILAASTTTPPSDPTTAPSTAGASGTYSEATATVTSTLDSSITNLAYDRCANAGHAGTSKGVPFLLFPGFSQTKSQFTQAMKRRLADYVDPVSGRAPFVLGISSRGRGTGGTIDYVRDRQDRDDCVKHAVAAVGASNLFASGRGVVVIGYSTGCLDALLYACTFPDSVLAIVLYYPNFDLGVDPADSYWALQSTTQRTTYLVPQVGDRAQGSAAAIDPYLARNPIDAIARIVALPGGPHIWILGDRTEAPAVPIPNPDRLAAALRAVPGAISKTHVHITQAGDVNRILHDAGVDGAGTIYSERFWVTTVLAGAAEWSMPREAPPNGLRLLGWMRTRTITGSVNPSDDRPGFEVWTGTVVNPKANAAGGRLHACEFRYWDTGRQFTFDPVTSQNGYLQVLRDASNRSYDLTAGSKLILNLNVSMAITAFADLGFQHEWKGGVGVTGTTQVTNWADQIGALAFTATAGTTCPATATDADGKALLRFDATSSQKLLLNQLLVDPTKDFTICMVVNKTNATAQFILEMSHHGTAAVLNIAYTSGVTSSNHKNDAGTYATLNTNGIGGQPFSQNAKHFVVLMRKNGADYISIDGSAWSLSTVPSDSFTTTGTNTTTIGCGWANGGGAYWQFLTGDVYHLVSKDSATGEADLLAGWKLAKDTWTF